MPSLKGFCHPAESLTQFQHSPHSVKLDMMMICIVYHTGTFSWGFSCRGGPLILLNGPSLLKMQIAKYFANGVEVQASMQARTQASTWESKQAKYRGYRIALTLFAQRGAQCARPLSHICIYQSKYTHRALKKLDFSHLRVWTRAVYFFPHRIILFRRKK